MNVKNPFLIALMGLVWNGLEAQSVDLKLKDLQYIRQTSYELNKEKRQLLSVRESWFDERAILTRQERYGYIAVDTGSLLANRYHYEYDTTTRKGKNYTERLVTPRNKNYSRQETRFTSYDHSSDKRVSSQQYSSDTKLQTEIENSYDAQGNLVKTILRDHTYAPPMLQTDEMQRNAAGKMTRWTSYDEQGGAKREQVRDFSWEYLNDTLLLRSSGYVYNDWTETVNKYSKGVLKQSTQSVGTRQTNGKTTITNKMVTNYANGKPISATETVNGKKTRTIAYTYFEEGYKEEAITTKEGVTVNGEKELYLNDTLLIERLWTTNDEKTRQETHQYDALGQRIRSVFIEFKSNGDEWKTEFELDEHGNPTHRLFFINKHLQQEDVYEYKYFD